MVANTDNFLDLWDIWVNELIGSVWLFIFLGIVVISYLSVKSKFSLEVVVVLNVLFLTIVFANATGLSILWIFIVLGVGTLFYYIYQKTIRQG